MADVAVDPEALLAGPRGRRVCWELLVRTGGWEWDEPPQSAGPEALADSLRAAVARSDVGALAVAPEPASFLPALADAVAWARYWQEPDDTDRRLADPRVAEQLQPVAEMVSRAPAAGWWSTTVELAGQHEVVFDQRPEFRVADPPDDGRGALAAWREDTLDDERRAAERPDDVPFSGDWWSTPAGAWLRRSTRSLGPAGPVGLLLVEDEQGWKSARCWKLRTPADPSIYEIRGPGDWAELVARYPLEVTKARRHDWWRATGHDETWAIPDYAAVAADYDAIHLTVCAYLSTAGRAVRAGDAHTVLAGWNPEETWWLTDSPRRTGDPQHWVRDPEPPFLWKPGRA